MNIKLIIISLVIIIIGTIGLFIKSSNNLITLQKAELLLDSCQIDSVGTSHDDLLKKVFSIRVKNVHGGSWYKVNQEYKEQFYRKLEEMKLTTG